MRPASPASRSAVVLGAHAADIAPALRQSADRRSAEPGLGGRPRQLHPRGRATAPPRCAGALLLLLGDQVAVTADDLRRLYASWRRHPVLIAAALYAGAPGLPAIFPRWAFTRPAGAARRPRSTPRAAPQRRPAGARADEQRGRRPRHAGRPAAARNGAGRGQRRTPHEVLCQCDGRAD